MQIYKRSFLPVFQDSRGTPLDRWTMCNKEEEPLVLQQFLRFGETRPITQQLLLQELSERHQTDQDQQQRARAQHEIKRLIERNSARTPTTPPTTPLLSSGSHNGLLHAGADTKESPIPKSPVSLKRSSPSPPPPHMSQHSPKLNYISSASSPGGNVNGNSTSPLNRLQNMQPFDYRKHQAEQLGRSRTPDSAAMQHQQQSSRVPPSIPPQMRIPPSASMAAAAGLAGLPLLTSVSGIPSSLASTYHSTIASMANKVRKEKNRTKMKTRAS